jgi:dipeptidyl aminopeptidase/acylaminoacyl peptidase
MGHGSLNTILHGEGGEDWNHSTAYSSPLWSPDGKRLTVLYRDFKDRWAALDRVGIYSFDGSSFSLVTTEDKLELYAPKMRWIEKDQIYLENTERASRHLFVLSVKDGSERAMGNPKGDESNFSFSADGRQMAFVRQSMADPPEIYFSREATMPAQKITSLNGNIGAFQLPEYESIQWKAPDGIQVQGWLVKPPGFKETQHYPLLVMVHGGPTYVISNRFDIYEAWPYPFRIFALRGYLVFLPNYRGTATFGKEFRTPRDIGQVPSDDILSGISFLTNRGIVDPERIGIMGQSHGGWLAPYVMAKKKMFRAASVAEGSLDLFSIYGHMPGWLDLNVHEYYFGSPYDDPQRFIQLSPIFNFSGLRTATLMEYGEQNLSVDGLELLTAIWRHGIPHEFIIYPNTGHNIASPTLQIESMNRNLDWFDYWMLGKQDPDPKKQNQYERWKKMTVEMEKLRSWTPETLAH